MSPLNPPQLQIGHSLWSLEKLPFNSAPEWTLEEKVRRVKAAGFQHLECWLPSPELRSAVPPLLQTHGLELRLVERLNTVAEIRELISFGAQVRAKSLTCQPATPFHSLQEVAHLVTEGAHIAADNGLEFYVETHRGTFTENIRQTLELIAEVPNIAFAVDLSHYVVGGEIDASQLDIFLDRIRPILDRAAHLHGRISNGQQVQVEIREEDSATQFFRQLWTQLFIIWQRKAAPGDTLTFSTELGPPPYSPLLSTGQESFDRWAQSLVMKELVERLWEEIRLNEIARVAQKMDPSVETEFERTRILN